MKLSNKAIGNKDVFNKIRLSVIFLIKFLKFSAVLPEKVVSFKAFKSNSKTLIKYSTFFYNKGTDGLCLGLEPSRGPQRAHIFAYMTRQKLKFYSDINISCLL